MGREYLKDGQGNTIGWTDDDGRGDVVIHDRQGNYLGRYIQAHNVTEDRQGQRVGTGNQVTRLLR